MKNRVLITSVGRKVSLVKAFKEAGWYVIGRDADPSSIALKFCDAVFDPNRHSYHIRIPTRDAEIIGLDGSNIDNRILGVPTTPDETIAICQDKLKFYHWCKGNGFKTPEVYFVKPRVSSSGKETECVWQEMVEGEEYSVDLFADFNSQVISVVPRKRIKTFGGESVATVTESQESITTSATLLASKLGLIGHNVLQCFLVNNSPVWTDVNCRFGGASIVGIKAGCKSPEWLLKLINGEKVEPCIGDYKVGLLGKSYTDWTFDEN